VSPQTFFGLLSHGLIGNNVFGKFTQEAEKLEVQAYLDFSLRSLVLKR
jgi:hypothetical protein